MVIKIRDKPKIGVINLKSGRQKMKRRMFLKSTAATAGVFTLTGAMPAVAAPAKGGRLVLATTSGASGDSLDPTTFTSVGHGLTGCTIGNCLTEIDGNTGFGIPCLYHR